MDQPRISSLGLFDRVPLELAERILMKACGLPTLHRISVRSMEPSATMLSLALVSC